MALKAGYRGVKESLFRIIENLSTAKVIKSFGDGLSLTEQGELDLDYATASKAGGIKVGSGLEIVDGVLNAVGADSIELDDVTGVAVTANVAVPVTEGDIYLFFADNGAAITGGSILAGDLSKYILISGVGIAYAIVKMTGSSFTSSKVGALIQLKGASDVYGYSFGGADLSKTSFAYPDGAVCACITTASAIASSDVEVIGSVKAAFDYVYALIKTTDDSQTFTDNMNIVRISATKDYFI